MQSNFKAYLGVDLKKGFVSNIYKYVVALFLFLFLSFELFFSQSQENESLIFTTTDLWFYIFQGMPVYEPSNELPFIIPLQWMIIQILPALLVLNYPTKDLYSYGIQEIVRLRKRCNWWISKCIWLVLSIAAYYAIAFLCVNLVSLFFGEYSFSFNHEYFELFYSPNSDFEKTSFVMYILPLSTTITISFFQMLFSIIIKPIYSFFIVVCYDIISAFYCFPLLIGDKTMLLRLSLFESGKVDFEITIIINFILFIFTYFIGSLYFSKMDFIKKG